MGLISFEVMGHLKSKKYNDSPRDVNTYYALNHEGNRLPLMSWQGETELQHFDYGGSSDYTVGLIF